MPILFHFGKTTIVEKSQPFLDSVGQMLTSEAYADRTLVVEGHTDAVGARAYNQRLSELRALAIKEYLVEQFSIDPYRLFPVGKGEDMLYRPDSPKDALNRRVEFLPYSGSKGLQSTKAKDVK
jgi:outer membrane protein OmpA-like peptidoglycan-associated protein